MSNRLYIDLVRIEPLDLDGVAIAPHEYGFQLYDDYEGTTQCPYESWEEMNEAIDEYEGARHIRVLKLLLDEEAFPYRADVIYDLIDFQRSVGNGICICSKWCNPWKELEKGIRE